MKKLLISGIFLATNAIASVYNNLTLENIVKKADIIVHGTIKSLNPVNDKGKPWAIYSVDVKNFLRGESKDLAQSEDGPSFRVLGGKNLTFKGAPTFTRGQEVVLFLYKEQYDSPIVGFNQGAYVVQPGGLITDLDKKSVLIEVSGKKVEAKIDTFLATLKTLVGTK